MIKTLQAAQKSEKEKFSIPRSVQQSIPIRRIYSDGIWQVSNKHSKTWRVSDVNYAAASPEDRRAIFTSYGAVLNSLPTDATAKISIFNRRLNPVTFRETVLMRERGDELDRYRREYNEIITGKAAESNNLVQEKYITLSIAQRKIEETRAYFRRVDSNLSKTFGRLDSGARPVSGYDRLRLLHDFFRPGEEQYFTYDQARTIRGGADFRDMICPDSLSFKADYFEMGGKFGRVLFLKEFASYVSDELIAALSDFSRSMVISVDILPIPTDEAVKEVQSRILGVETDITRWQQRQNAKNNFTATVPYELEQLRAETKEFLDDLTVRDQRMIFAVVTLVHIADTKEQLDADTESLISIGREKLCQFSVLRYQQEDGLNTVLPYGLRRIDALRTLTTESTAVLMPFRAQEIQDPGGQYYGINAISRNLLLCDRKRLISPHAFYLGVSGSGKSVAMKNTALSVILGTNDDVIIIDAEREYNAMGDASNGSVIEISPHSPHHINPLDIGDGYADDENPVALKSEVITSILEQQMGAGTLTAAHKSIMDRCTANVYRPYFKAKGKLPPPLLTDWRAEVLKQPEPEALRVATALELYCTGSLNLFNFHTNVNLDARVVCIVLKDMGENLRKIAMHVTNEFVSAAVNSNFEAGISTWCYFDEFHILLRDPLTASYFVTVWKMLRKKGCVPSALTQNVKVRPDRALCKAV